MAVSEWHVSGSYFESCNCEPICPCRRIGERPSGRSTYGECFGTLSWHITSGEADGLDLSGLGIALSLRYFDDEPGSPWSVILYVDDRANPRQFDALADIFLGRAGGTPLHNFAASIGTVHAIRAAHIKLDHRSQHQEIVISDMVTVRAADDVDSDVPVACGIPGFEYPGQEVRSEVLRSSDAPLVWEVRGRCGFASVFSYSSVDT
jgi:hypothetical protein